MINLAQDTINKDDIDYLIEWLSTYPRLTKGPITKLLEEKWSNKIEVKHSVFCNSGSSANLLMLASLIESGKVKKGSKVVVPGLSWATDLAPVMQLGFEPVICDINLKDLSIDLSHLELIFNNEKPSVVILVSVLGLVPEMDKIKKLCDNYEVILLEDVCESIGSKFKDRNLGTFGLMSSFSTYFGHHISTIEGGMVSTSDREIFNILKSIRSHGWDRDIDEDYKIELSNTWNVDNFNSLYTFYYAGFNLRSTDLQAKIGLRQVSKLDDICQARNKNFNLYTKFINNDYWMPKQKENVFVSNFAYPVIHPNRKKIVEKLKEKNIEVRPLICGSMCNQPFYVEKYGRKKLPNSEIVDKYGFYIPNHPELTEVEIKMISSTIMECIK